MEAKRKKQTILSGDRKNFIAVFLSFSRSHSSHLFRSMRTCNIWASV